MISSSRRLCGLTMVLLTAILVLASLFLSEAKGDLINDLPQFATSRDVFDDWMCTEEYTCTKSNDDIQDWFSKFFARLIIYFGQLGDKDTLSRSAHPADRLLFEVSQHDKELRDALIKIEVGSQEESAQSRVWKSKGGWDHNDRDEHVFQQSETLFVHRLNSARTFLKKLVDGEDKNSQENSRRKSEKLKGKSKKYPYFGMLPAVLGTVIPEGGPISYETPCFSDVEVYARYTDNTTVTVYFRLGKQKSFLCTDTLALFGGSQAYKAQIFDTAGSKKAVMNLTKAFSIPEERWYVNTLGIHVLLFPEGVLGIVRDAVATYDLFGLLKDPTLTPKVLADNLDFMVNYVEASPRMQPVSAYRTSGAYVADHLAPSYIQSGDAILVYRVNGIASMIAWGEGSTVGHTTIAMRDEQGDLHVCESTTKALHWPTNGIQCHAYIDWLHLAELGGHNVVVVPLAEEYRQKFNVTKAWEWFKATEGTDYGYPTFVFGWLDLPADNLPCVPDDYTTCLNEVTTELLAIVVDRLQENDNSKNPFRQALNHRIGTWPSNLNVVQVLKYAYTKLNMTRFSDLYTIPEQDAWMYNTSRFGKRIFGKSQVCCVFVCNMWKAGGVFSEIDSDLQCGEQTIWDLYSMKILDEARMGDHRPEVCQKDNPVNELCQLMGNVTVYLRPDLNTRTLYKNMGEKCASKPPEYRRAPGC